MCRIDKIDTRFCIGSFPQFHMVSVYSIGFIILCITVYYVIYDTTFLINIDIHIIMQNIVLIGQFLKKFSVKNIRQFSSSIEQKIGIDGISINYLKVGNGPKNILCLPGALGTIWSDFKPQIEKLDRNKFTLVAWDPPGYGKSRPPARDFSPGFFYRDADFAAKLMKELKYDKYSLLGWSDGGITSLIIASKYQNNIDKLIVWGSNAYVTSEDIKLYQGIRDISKWSEPMRAPLISSYGEEYLKKTWESWVDSFVHIFEKEKGDICSSELKNINCPTMIMHGVKDPLVPAEHPQYLIKNIKNCRYHEFEKGKHNIHLRFADEFNAIVEQFLSN